MRSARQFLPARVSQMWQEQRTIVAPAVIR
jgi:hypothetical protein